MPVISLLSKRLIANSILLCILALIRCVINLFKSIERPKKYNKLYGIIENKKIIKANKNILFDNTIYLYFKYIVQLYLSSSSFLVNF